MESNRLIDRPDSREDKNTIESQVSRLSKASLATLWKGLVCRMYDINHWELSQSGNSYVSRL